MGHWTPLFACTLILGCGAPSSETHPMPRVDHLMLYGASPLPFSPAVRVGDRIYLSGQIGNKRGDMTGVVPGGVEAETRQALENIKDILERSGSSMDRVVKCTVMLLDMAEW